MHALRLHGTLGKFTWRMCATVLAGQAVCILLGALVARGVTAAGEEPGRGAAYLVVGFALAALAVVAAGGMRRPWGVTVGWLVQVLTLASAVVVPAMLVVGLFFLALWVTCLVKGTAIDSEMAEQERRAEDDALGEEDAADGPGPGPDGPGPADRVDG